MVTTEGVNAITWKDWLIYQKYGFHFIFFPYLELEKIMTEISENIYG